MKRLILIVIIIFCGLNARAQVVYSTDWKSEVDAGKGIWYFTQWKSEAKKIVYFTEYKSEADLIIYFTQYKSEAGWRKKSKQHQMY